MYIGHGFVIFAIEYLDYGCSRRVAAKLKRRCGAAISKLASEQLDELLDLALRL